MRHIRNLGKPHPGQGSRNTGLFIDPHADYGAAADKSCLACNFGLADISRNSTKAQQEYVLAVRWGVVTAVPEPSVLA